MPRGELDKYIGVKGYVPYYEEGKYDVALLHLDQQCLEPDLWERGKGSLFKELDMTIRDIPKVVIMHGTPYYPEMYSCDITPDNYRDKGYSEKQINMSSQLIEMFKEAVKDCSGIIFNSFAAKSQWGFDDDPRAITIHHGLDPNDWWDLTKEPRVVTMISPGGLDKYYDRTFLQSVKEELASRQIEHCHITVDARFNNWDEYRKFLGSSLIYFNPTRESPMPRARTEAMLSGCCIITTFNQDAERFMVDGLNGYRAVRNPKFIADLCEALISNYRRTVETGQRGKETALGLFNKDRYEEQMSLFFTEVIKSYGK